MGGHGGATSSACVPCSRCVCFVAGATKLDPSRIKNTFATWSRHSCYHSIKCQQLEQPGMDTSSISSVGLADSRSNFVSLASEKTSYRQTTRAKRWRDEELPGGLGV